MAGDREMITGKQAKAAREPNVPIAVRTGSHRTTERGDVMTASSRGDVLLALMRETMRSGAPAGIGEATGNSAARNERADAPSWRSRASKRARSSVAVGSAHELNGDANFATQTRGVRLEMIFVSWDLDEMVATAGEAVRIGCTNAGRGAGNEGCAEGKITHARALCIVVDK
jgi:hypothetical protein